MPTDDKQQANNSMTKKNFSICVAMNPLHLYRYGHVIFKSFQHPFCTLIEMAIYPGFFLI